MKHEWKFRYVVVLGILYFASFWLLTVGYFTPNWVLDYQRINSQYDVFECSTLGLISGSCRYPYGSYNFSTSVGQIGHVMQVAMFLTTTSIVVVYSNALLLGVAIFFSLFENQLFMPFLAISFGVLYPIASILVVGASAYVEATQTSGYSALLCNVAGGIMMLFYIGLRVYDAHYISQRRHRNTGVMSLGLSKSFDTPARRKVDKLKRVYRYTTAPGNTEVKARYDRPRGIMHRKSEERMVT